MEREALKLALETFESMNHDDSIFKGEFDGEIAVIKKALAQPAQEPVAYTLNCVCGAVWDIKADGSEEMAHTPDTTPPQRPWVELTDTEIDAEANSILTSDPVQWWRRFARAVLAKSREKNNGT